MTMHIALQEQKSTDFTRVEQKSALATPQGNGRRQTTNVTAPEQLTAHRPRGEGLLAKGQQSQPERSQAKAHSGCH